MGIHDNKLRFFTDAGVLVPSPTEQAVAERQQRERAEQQAMTERQQREFAEQQAMTERQQRERAEQEIAALRSRLRELGVDPELPQ